MVARSIQDTEQETKSVLKDAAWFIQWYFIIITFLIFCFLLVTEYLFDFNPGTLWNLSSHDSVKMEIVDHALHALVDEVVVPHSGWERGNNGGEESCKPRHLEWETALTNTAGCLRYRRDPWMESRASQTRKNRLI